MSKEVGELIEAALKTYKSRIYTINRLVPRTIVVHRPTRVLVTPLGEFTTNRAAAKAHGISDNTMYQWLHRKKEGFYYKETDNEEN